MVTRAAVLAVLAVGAAGQAQRWGAGHSKVSVKGAFPKHLNNVLPTGENITLVYVFVNDAERPMNVTGAFASLHNPGDHAQVLGNLSYLPASDMVAPGQELTFEYRTRIFPIVESTDLQFAAVVFYSDVEKQKRFVSVIFNETVTLSAFTEKFKARTAAAYALGAVVAALGFFFVKDLILGAPKKAAAAASTVEDDSFNVTAGGDSGRGGKKRASKASH